ncbi:gag-pol polyprotein [Trichonephila clavipes]|nr:gag-pol polyprotein [Trichonephila clavipes]
MAEPSKHTSRLFLLDRKSGQKFLIDSGSEICVIPPSPTMNKSPQSNFSLFAANNTKIPAYGMVRKELNLGLRRPFIWTFIIADVSSPIIGADFLKHFNLLIDLKKKKVGGCGNFSFHFLFFQILYSPHTILTVDANISFKNILSEYPDFSNPSLTSKSASHGTVHHIITTGPPVTARPRRLHPKLYDAVKVEFEFLLAQGIIRPSKSLSPWSSPLHVVPKSDSTVRPVGDYRQLNSVTERFLPKAAEQQYLLSEFLKGSKGKDSKPLNWSSEAITAFQRCKQALADAALLAHPSPSAPLALHVDASDYAIESYNAYDRELLAIYSAIRHFRYMLEARDFTVFTDHKPLTYAFRQKSDKCSPRQIRQLDFISQFTTNIVHIPGSDNIAADVLSRVSAITFPSQIDYDCIAETQQTDQELHTLIASGTSLELKR